MHFFTLWESLSGCSKFFTANSYGLRGALQVVQGVAAVLAVLAQVDAALAKGR